jgi:hypothetical protein
MYHGAMHSRVIVSTKGKRAANAVSDRFGKGFPANLSI